MTVYSGFIISLEVMCLFLVYKVLLYPATTTSRTIKNFLFFSPYNITHTPGNEEQKRKRIQNYLSFAVLAGLAVCIILYLILKL